MLLELRVENYAVIDSVAVEFASGLNLLTGETGAGKSILIDALALLLGERSSSEMIRHGEEKAVISGVFESRDSLLSATLSANGIDSEDGQLIVRREITSQGLSGDIDTAVFSGPRADYDITTLGAVTTVVHARGAASDGTDTITNVELLQFTDQAVALCNDPVSASQRKRDSNLRARSGCEVGHHGQQTVKKLTEWGRGDSNLRHRGCKPRALTAELRPPPHVQV